MSGFQQKTGLFEYAVHQKKLTPRSFLAMFLSIISVFMVVYFLVTANCGTPVAIAHRLLFVLFIMILAFFLHPTKRKNWYEPLNIWSVYDIACVVLAVVCVVYYISDLDNWQLRMFRPSRLDTFWDDIHFPGNGYNPAYGGNDNVLCGPLFWGTYQFCQLFSRISEDSADLMGAAC